jgi:hypothetical protein
MEPYQTERVVKVEVKLDELSDRVEKMSIKVDAMHDLLMQAKGARSSVLAMAALVGFLSSKAGAVLSWLVPTGR